MKVKNLFLLFSGAAFLFLSACRQKKELQKAKAEEMPIVTPAAFSLHDSMQIHTFRYHTISAKVKTVFIGNDGSDMSVMVTMRGVSDSAIWMSVSPALGIEAARILFTRDSVKIMDKIHGEYARESYSFLKRFSEAEITVDILQNILTGNAAFLNNDLITDSMSRYYMAHCTQNQLLQELTVTKLFRVFANVITDRNTADRINVSYSDFQFVEQEYFPFDIKIEANSKGKTAKILMSYSNVSVNAPVEIRFNIPASYTKMKY